MSDFPSHFGQICPSRIWSDCAFEVSRAQILIDGKFEQKYKLRTDLCPVVVPTIRRWANERGGGRGSLAALWGRTPGSLVPKILTAAPLFNTSSHSVGKHTAVHTRPTSCFAISDWKSHPVLWFCDASIWHHHRTATLQRIYSCHWSCRWRRAPSKRVLSHGRVDGIPPHPLQGHLHRGRRGQSALDWSSLAPASSYNEGGE